MESQDCHWSNECILKLLEEYKKEPCLWDPRSKNYKQRSTHTLAWKRILSKLPFKTTVDEAKRKRNSLMSYYRLHLNRYKNALAITGGKANYHTTWFAFDAMHSFLSPIYGPKKKIIPKKNITGTSPAAAHEVYVEETSEPVSGLEDNYEEDMFIDKADFSIDVHHEPPLRSELHSEVNVNKDVLAIKIEQGEEECSELKEMNENTSVEVNTPSVRESKEKSNPECNCTKQVVKPKQGDLDEYDHFGCVIASKIRKISSMPEREKLMNAIQNLVFETYMKCESGK